MRQQPEREDNNSAKWLDQRGLATPENRGGLLGAPRVAWQPSPDIVKISIIIPAYNEEKLIGGTLAKIATACRTFDEQVCGYEVIVCDNNSTDRTAQLARDAGASVVFEPVNQIGRARNCGAAAATGDWLLFIDADSHPSPELFNDMLQVIRRGDCLAGGCTISMPTRDKIAGWIVKFWNLTSRVTRSVAGSFIFCETKAFRDLGGFSLELYASEEIELSKRLRKLARTTGRKIVILNRHPLLTSDRKLHLYTRQDYSRFFLRTAFRFGRTLNSPKECHIWYDGRR